MKLLDEGTIPSRKVGVYRRVLASDVLQYKQQNEAARHQALDELTKQAQELDMDIDGCLSPSPFSMHVFFTPFPKDFPQEALDPYGIEAVHPDVFVMRCIEVYKDAVYRAVLRQQQALRNPAKNTRGGIGALERNGLKDTVRTLRSHHIENLKP